ncbi:Rap guanine nucleotide exchange factor 5 [Acipenser ruthenus]|uniref:Rap guanine nucleotide exchange factor 5 n=1 Tax=Acipenser ruthenus TaxID=7906 RepID=A0A444UAQ6_ACIRT|nr:Rap guanine nucleotide exchange factor 5 [Acipenser ruthenus]
MEGSGDIPGTCTPDVGLLATWRWSKNAKEQVHLKQKIKDLPALLKHGLHLRKKTAETIVVPDATSGPGTGISKWKACSQSFPCAGRALRNAFVAASPHPAKDQIQLARIIRRSYVGLELVEWILQQCLFIQCRVVAAGVWQILLELGILLSVDQNNVFEDANAYYQFSYEECDIQDCPFRNEQEWHNGVRLLMQLVPYVQFRIAVVNQPEEETEDKKQFCNEVLQMKALERLTSTPGAVCTLHDRDDISRIEMVQRLAKDSYRFLQTPNNTASDKTFEWKPIPSFSAKEQN